MTTRTVISLYTGVGGLDFGFEAAGFQTAVAVDLHATACNTLRSNRDWPILEGDIHTLPSREILKAGNLKVGEADVLIGGPPCQPFSRSSYWLGGDALRLDDPRSSTLAAYLRVLRDARPKTFLLENVYGMAYRNKDEGLQYLLDGIAEVNRQAGTKYSVRWKILNAAQYGVPQLRERVFLVGSRNGEIFKFPSPTHRATNVETDESGLEPYRTAWDAIGDLSDQDDPSLVALGTWGDLLPSIPEGQNYLWHTDRGGGLPLFGWRTRYWSFLLKLKKNAPSWTIQAQPGSATGPFHWKNRKLSATELCRIQTFPNEILFDCGRTDMQRMVGNAVPSLLAEVLANCIRSQFLGGRNTKTLKLLPRSRLAPRATAVRPVPQKYYKLIGAYAAHPGEGKGPGVSKKIRERRKNKAAALRPELTF